MYAHAGIISNARGLCKTMYDERLNPCSCGSSNPRIWQYESTKKRCDLRYWGVYCERCRSHKATEVGRHRTIEDAIDGWNSWHDSN